LGLVSVSAEAPGRAPGAPAPEDHPATSTARPARPLVVTGGIAACAAAGTGLAALTTLTAIGWITAPHAGLGNGLAGVLRTAASLWLVAHHVGFSVRGFGRIGMLPLGLVLLPGALLWQAGRWVVRAGGVARLRHVGYAALAIAFPYALLAGALAVASRTAVATPSLWQAVVAAFLLAVVAGGLGAARGLAPWTKLAGLLPARPRSVVMGVICSLAVLTAIGALLAGGSLVGHLHEVRSVSDALQPGMGGAVLLLLAELAYVPNAIVWAVAYTLGPGFAFGVGTVVAPTGSALGAVPVFPLLAALPSGSRAGVPVWISLTVLAAPYLAGIFGGIVTVRITPTPMLEAAPLWGFATGAATGCVTGVLAAFAGGPLGDGRLASVGPSGLQVGLVSVLEIGVTAALAAGGANWFTLHRRARALHAAAVKGDGPGGTGGGSPPCGKKVGGGLSMSPEAGGSLSAPSLADTNAAYGAGASDGGDSGAGGSVAGGSAAAGIPAVIDETDDAGGHRIYLNPWADREQVEDSEDPGDGPGNVVYLLADRSPDTEDATDQPPVD
jgi:hypothetical protein